jgi:histidine phosphotransfer protein HptB
MQTIVRSGFWRAAPQVRPPAAESECHALPDEPTRGKPDIPRLDGGRRHTHPAAASQPPGDASELLTMDPKQDDDAAPKLDEQALVRLRELDPDGRHGVVQRVLQAYETSLERQLAKAVEARAAGDAAAVGAIAHMLKSSSASVGALTLAARCTEIDRAVRSGTLADLGTEVETLLAEGRRALMAVRAMLRS